MQQGSINKTLRDGRRDRYLRYKVNGWNQVRWIAIDDMCLSDHGRVFDITAPDWLDVLKKHKTCRCRFVAMTDDDIAARSS